VIGEVSKPYKSIATCNSYFKFILYLNSVIIKELFFILWIAIVQSLKHTTTTRAFHFPLKIWRESIYTHEFDTNFLINTKKKEKNTTNENKLQHPVSTI